MRLITIFELATKSQSELQALFREATAQAVESLPGSTERREAVAALANVVLALTLRRGP